MLGCRRLHPGYNRLVLPWPKATGYTLDELRDELDRTELGVRAIEIRPIGSHPPPPLAPRLRRRRSPTESAAAAGATTELPGCNVQKEGFRSITPPRSPSRCERGPFCSSILESEIPLEKAATAPTGPSGAAAVTRLVIAESCLGGIPGAAVDLHGIMALFPGLRDLNIQKDALGQPAGSSPAWYDDEHYARLPAPGARVVQVVGGGSAAARTGLPSELGGNRRPGLRALQLGWDHCYARMPDVLQIIADSPELELLAIYGREFSRASLIVCTTALAR